MTKIMQDQIYGPVQLDDYIVRIIDTVYFQRTRRLKQNGNAYMVFPSANHTRFEHCIGVYHLSNKLLQQFESQSNVFIKSEEDRQQFKWASKLIKIAAVCHDIGHGPFSHLFEEVLRRLNIKISHEDVGCIIIEKMLKQQQYPVNEIEIIQNLIRGDFIETPPFNKYLFLQQIVSNSVSSLDTDKLDYLVRDSRSVALAISVSAERILANCYIFQYGEKFLSCYENNVAFEVQQVFQARYALHKMLYQHAKTITSDQNCLEVLLLADQYGIVSFKKAIEKLQSDSDDWFDQFDELDDHLVDTIQILIRRYQKDEKQEGLRNAIEKYKTHQLYPSVYRAFINSQFFGQSPHQLADQLRERINDANQFIAVKEIHFGMREKNPMEFIAFKHKNNRIVMSEQLKQVLKLEDSVDQNVKIIQSVPFQLSTPTFFREYGIYVYYKENKNKVQHDQLKELALKSRNAIKELMSKKSIELSLELDAMEQFVFE